MGVAPTDLNATTWFSDLDDSLLYCYCDRQDHPEGATLASSPSQIRPPFDQRDPLLTEGPSSSQCLSYFEARPVGLHVPCQTAIDIVYIVHIHATDYLPSSRWRTRSHPLMADPAPYSWRRNNCQHGYLSRTCTPPRRSPDHLYWENLVDRFSPS